LTEIEREKMTQKKGPGRPKKPDRKVKFAFRIRPDQRDWLKKAPQAAAKLIEIAIDLLRILGVEKAVQIIIGNRGRSDKL
jgi:hypothetical protein